jgi:hypothetical protein
LPSDFKHSFKRPYFFYNDTRNVPHWDLFFNVITSQESIRLTPSVPNMRGGIWSQIPNPHSAWQVSAVIGFKVPDPPTVFDCSQVEFSFTAYGRNYIGGEGLALWYTKERGDAGDVLGFRDYWNGLGVLCDTADFNANTKSVGRWYREYFPAVCHLHAGAI